MANDPNEERPEHELEADELAAAELGDEEAPPARPYGEITGLYGAGAPGDAIEEVIRFVEHVAQRLTDERRDGDERLAERLVAIHEILATDAAAIAQLGAQLERADERHEERAERVDRMLAHLERHANDEGIARDLINSVANKHNVIAAQVAQLERTLDAFDKLRMAGDEELAGKIGELRISARAQAERLAVLTHQIEAHLAAHANVGPLATRAELEEVRGKVGHRLEGHDRALDDLSKRRVDLLERQLDGFAPSKVGAHLAARLRRLEEALDLDDDGPHATSPAAPPSEERGAGPVAEVVLEEHAAQLERLGRLVQKLSEASEIDGDAIERLELGAVDLALVERLAEKLDAVRDEVRRAHEEIEFMRVQVRGAQHGVFARLAALERANAPATAAERVRARERVRSLERRAFAVELLVACCYAAGLELVRERYERAHLTELPVIGGVVLSLFPAAWLARRAPTTWREHERRTVRGFMVAAVPITLWQGALFVRRLLARRGAA
jgi:hypothetical protein